KPAKAPKPPMPGSSPDIALGAGTGPEGDTSDVKWGDMIVTSQDASGVEIADDSGVEIAVESDHDLALEMTTEGKKTKTLPAQPGDDPPTAVHPTVETTHRAPKVGKPTQMPAKSTPTTMLAPLGAENEIVDMGTEEPAKPKGAPTAGPKKTQMAGKTGQPTKM